MALRLRPAAQDELTSFVAAVRADYEASMVTDGGMGEEEARAKADRDFASLVQDGRPAEGQHLYVIEDVDTGGRVGRLWLGERFTEQPIGFVYDVEIAAPLRGRGLGREAMMLIEEEARRRGLAEIRLNVFGGNETARSLYRSLGYAEFAIGMRKRLT